MWDYILVEMLKKKILLRTHRSGILVQSEECPGRQRDTHPVGHMVVRNRPWLQPRTDDRPAHLPRPDQVLIKVQKAESAGHDLR